ncbi:hypothetical protein AVDCRST_MAG81-306 [uncultured Synechococcales cyanobacterium]|uniref:Uncharacterized protein n=1 Tax=uncultured Synechococcales cyanobacterium TaxID=1936017 RepID=A0A6J4UPD3_9CYAN|nr:hypothetical protein AVDCRST_MAG81-306 [uncultured Synechococcales cyanobacterium]
MLKQVAPKKSENLRAGVTATLAHSCLSQPLSGIGRPW